ncbi:uncharacterized protein DNG_09791 [Cephalotrichum gorgonifer]|uniref:LysM domain-containing protein n=1 Tax=Cephalotrichum gorgonifer TaxID=2041049 RepID=A0AAE8T0E4_9PEZI|nr:uncharacterized protein DNG_09791 [Cephalotrichum gorgonifer]
MSLTCLQDSGRWCNVVAAAAAFAEDPGDPIFSFAPISGDNETVVDPCDLCFIKRLKLEAESPYYSGQDLVSQGVYESKTSSCSVSDMPLTMSSLPVEITITPEPTQGACKGTTYDIQPGDNCRSIATSQNIGLYWLLTDNGLGSFCSDFPTSGLLCLVNTCETYSLQANDTCKAIAKVASITVTQLHAWNPVIGTGCSNLGYLLGDPICISQPGGDYIDPVGVDLAPSMPTTPAPVPTDVAEGTNERCGLYHLVERGDFCNELTVKFGITLEDFVFLNPSINHNCTNLLADENYCVRPVGDINTYPGRAGAEDVLTAIPTTIPFTPFTTALESMATTNGAELQDDTVIEGTSFASQCEFAAAVYGVDIKDFVTWNAGLADPGTAKCVFSSEARYCAKLYPSVSGEDEDMDPGHEYPIRDGAIASCIEWADVSDDYDCETLLEDYDLTIDQFYEYNPGVGVDCSNLWQDDESSTDGNTEATSGAPPTGTATGTSPSPTPPAPIHAGQPSSCNAWHVVKNNDACDAVEDQYGLSHEQFLKWNPEVSADCVVNFWVGYAYCVGVADGGGEEAKEPTMEVPAPVQEGNAVPECSAYAQAGEEGDYCAAFAERNGVSLEELGAWNALLGDSGAECETMFWAGYWYCVGVVNR